MSSSKHRKRRKSGGGHAPVAAANDPAVFLSLQATIDSIDRSEDPAGAGPLWGTVQRDLLKTSANKQEVARVVMSRDLGALRTLVSGLDPSRPPSAANADEASPTDHNPATAEPPASEHQFDPADLKHAMKAFRRRVKLMRLDDESRLSVRPLTSGRHSEISAIIPPFEFPRELWDELVRQGKLKNAGRGFYELAED